MLRNQTLGKMKTVAAVGATKYEKKDSNLDNFSDWSLCGAHRLWEPRFKRGR